MSMAAILPDRAKVSVTVFVSTLVGSQVLPLPVIGFQVQRLVPAAVILSVLKSRLVRTSFGICLSIAGWAAYIPAIAIPAAPSLIVAIVITVMAVAVTVVVAAIVVTVAAVSSIAIAVFVSTPIGVQILAVPVVSFQIQRLILIAIVYAVLKSSLIGTLFRTGLRVSGPGYQ
jgi:hypothetical protein